MPIADLIMESLMLAGVSKFCFVVGKHKSLLMDYVSDKGVTFVFQNEPKGFGDAVARGGDFAGSEPVFVHADDGVLTGGYVEAASLFGEKMPDAVLLLRKTDNPKRYGIAVVDREEKFMDHRVFEIKGVEEKPDAPKSDMMISAVYIFSKRIFSEIGNAQGRTGEIELTTGIQNLIKGRGRVYGLLLEKEKWLNVGDTDSYYKALNYSYDNL